MTPLTQKIYKVESLFSEWNKPGSPGGAVSIIQRGQIIYSRGFGMADLEHDIPISKNSVFDIGSISKQFVAMCVALLARRGKLSLDDEIQKHLSELKYYEYPITIRHLIHHTSGIRDYLTLMDLAGLRFENEYPDDETLNLIACQKQLNFHSGEEYLYSNSGYLLLAEIVKRTSGQTLRAFAEENIFAPLEMKDTFFHDDFSEIVKNRAIGYSPKESGGFRIDMSIFDAVGDGGVYTTVEDLCRWDANFYNNTVGGYGQDLIEEITTAGKLNSGEALDYAFGLNLGTYRGLRIIGHGGAWMGYRAEMTRFPEQSFSIICLFNLSSVNLIKLTKQVADIFLAEDFSMPEKVLQNEQRFIELSSSELTAKSGFYRNLKNGDIWKLTTQTGKLMAEVSGMSFQIAPTSLKHYKSVGVPFEISIEFDKHSPQSPVVMHVQIDGGKPNILERANTTSLDAVRLMDYSGDYYCEELACNYRIMATNSELTIDRRNSPREHLELVSRDLFKGACGSFEFICNTQNEVVGFTLSEGRVKNINFVKQY
jgi:CubicO group peptidase (beta-lactamase class C family)